MTRGWRISWGMEDLSVELPHPDKRAPGSTDGVSIVGWEKPPLFPGMPGIVGFSGQDQPYSGFDAVAGSERRTLIEKGIGDLDGIPGKQR